MELTESKIRKENSALNTRILLNDALQLTCEIQSMLIGTGIEAPETKKEYLKIAKRYSKREWVNSLMRRRRMRNQ